MIRYFKAIYNLLRLSVFVAVVAVFTGLYQFCNTPVVTELGSEKSLLVTPGTSTLGIAKQFAEYDLWPEPHSMAVFARVIGIADELKAGEYELTEGDTAWLVLKKLRKGAVIQHSLTIIEGWNFKQVRMALAKNTFLVQSLALKTDTQIMAMLGEPQQHPEGMFLPDTYHFTKGSSDFELLRRSYTAMQAELTRVWAERAANIPLQNAYEALILASIIEKETGLAVERPEIAGVFTRRLQKGMRLQTDPTVIYGMGSAYNGNITKADLRTATPYNTYTIAGLPPTPIAMPSRAALAAAVQPKAGSSLFFVASGNGGHVFSDNLAQHQRAVQAYLKTLRQSK